MSSKKILRWALDRETETKAEKTLLLVLAIHADTEGLISPGPSWTTLQRQSLLSRSTIHAALRGLEDQGLVIRDGRQRPNGSHSSCEYLLAVDAEEGSRPVQPSDGYPSSHRTGTGPAIGPVQPSDGSTRPAIGRVSSSENAGPVQPSDPTRPAIGPLEEKITTTTSSKPPTRDAHARTRDARARKTIHDNDANGHNDRPNPEQLARSGVSVEAYSLVARWRGGHDPRYRSGTYIAIGKEADAILRDGGDPDALTRALAVWDTRSDARPGLLPYLYDDELRNARSAAGRPLINPDGTANVPVDQIPDEALTRTVIEDILGPDHQNPPLAPREVEDGAPAVRAAWYRDAGHERLAQRRVEARRVLTKQQTRGSA